MSRPMILNKDVTLDLVGRIDSGIEGDVLKSKGTELNIVYRGGELIVGVRPDSITVLKRDGNGMAVVAYLNRVENEVEISVPIPGVNEKKAGGQDKVW